MTLTGVAAPLAFGAATGIALRLVFSGSSGGPYNVMMSAFIIGAPLVVGVVAALVAEHQRPRRKRDHFILGATANMLFVAGTLLILIEGWICAIIIMPLFALIGGLAGMVAGALSRKLRRPRRTLYCAAALPLLLGAVEHRLPLIDAAESVVATRLIEAEPDAVWRALLDTPEIAPDEFAGGLMYRIGVPVPISATVERADGALVRHIAMGKGIRFTQVAVDYREGERVAWTYRFAPDSFPAGALDDHVRIGGDYFDLLGTVYTLEPVHGGTRLTVEMRYRVSTRFNWYARPLAKLLVRDFENTALGFYAARATNPNAF